MKKKKDDLVVKCIQVASCNWELFLAPPHLWARANNLKYQGFPIYKMRMKGPCESLNAWVLCFPTERARENKIMAFK